MIASINHRICQGAPDEGMPNPSILAQMRL
jgi:hypothetical protein